MPQDRATQLDNLRKEFPSVSCVTDGDSGALLKVDHDIKLSPSTVYGLTLFVKVPQSFPKDPPVVTLPYCFQSVSIAPPNINPSELEAYRWEPGASTLVEAVRNALHNAADLWGPVTPPTMESVAQHLNGETDSLLHDLAANSNCLESYCYQLPIMRQMREASKQTVDEVERVANENVELRPVVEELQAEVERLQQQLRSQVDELQKLKNNSLVSSVCTPEALVATLEKDIQILSRECKALGKQALVAYASDRRVYQDTLEQYKLKCRQMHEIDLKRRAFKANKQL